MVSLLAVFAGLTAAYIAVLLLLARRESDRYQVVGPLIMLKTQAGKRLLNRLAKGRWVGGIADAFVAITILSGAVMLLLVIYQNILLFTHTEIVAQRPPRLEETLAIPGVNPVIPIGYGLFALLVALVIHEGGHGVLARHAKMRVKSLGLLFFVIPIGAFVEPDERALQGASLREKLRLFSAGPGPNIVLALICVVGFSQVMVAAMEPQHDGVAILGVSDGLPADQAGLEPGMFITQIEGVEITSYAAFNDTLTNLSSEDPIQVRTWHNGEEGTVTVLPLDKFEYYQDNLPELNKERFRDVPFLGVNPADGERLQELKAFFVSPFESQGVLRGSLFYVAAPFAGLQPFPGTFHDIYEPTGIFEGADQSYWVSANTLYWLFWINVVLGTFNALPFWVLDGGHMFRQSLHWTLRRRKGIDTDDLHVEGGEEEAPRYAARDPLVQQKLEGVDRQAKAIGRVVTTTMLVLILAPLIVPQFL